MNNVIQFKDKIRLKYVYISKNAIKRDVLDIAVLTENNDYIEYTLAFKQQYLTMYVSRRIRSLFTDYLIDSNTDIAVNDKLKEYHPMYQYLMILHQHINFKLTAITLDKIVSRIHYHYTGKSGTRYQFNKVWQLIVKKEQCPWITINVDLALQNKSPKNAKRIKIVRMAIFYLIVKNHLYDYVKKSIAKKKQNKI